MLRTRETALSVLVDRETQQFLQRQEEEEQRAAGAQALQAKLQQELQALVAREQVRDFFFLLLLASLSLFF